MVDANSVKLREKLAKERERSGRSLLTRPVEVHSADSVEAGSD